MQFRSASVALVLIALAFSGCAGAPEAVEPVQSQPGEDTAGTNETFQNATGNETPIYIAPLVDSFDVNVTGFDVIFAAEGFAPNATWTLDADGNGTDLNGTGVPFVANYTYEMAGNYTAFLVVDDNGTIEEHNVTLSIEDVAVEIPEPIVFTGSAMIPDPYYTATGWECVGSIFSDGSSGARHNFNIDIAGTWIYELDADGFTTLWTGPDSYQETDGGALGVIPGNTNRVYTCSESAIETDYTLTFYHPLHPDAPAL